ncbi:MAG: exodeoxyribonuclease V subunit beta [Edaphocola sp.]
MSNKTINYLPFNALTVPLAGTNLVEASAGTGKTYSIAILVLRLILEQDLSIDQILMVTFTKAAVAELQQRVRLFLREAKMAAEGHSIQDETIARLVISAQNNVGREKVNTKLKDSVLLMDELAVMTIHGFCQQTLTEFAFETGQVYGAEMFTDMDLLVEQELNDFWRRYITHLDVEVLALLGYQSLRQSIREMVKHHLDGKIYEGYDKNQTYELNLNVGFHDSLLQNAQHTIEQLRMEARDSFEQHRATISTICHTIRSPKKKEYIALLEDTDAFMQMLSTANQDNVLFKHLPQEFLEKFNRANHAAQTAQESVSLAFKQQVYYFAIGKISKAITAFLQKNNLMGYNDLIKNLHQSLTAQDNPALVAALQKKYKVVFVDEFQDTDRQQYEIFQKAFPRPTLLFYIGDPKQSIYAFRTADIHTYFRARTAADKVYEMNTNFRSSANMIAAMNLFFQPAEEFDTFAFSGQPEGFGYAEVGSPQPNKKGKFCHNGTVAPAMSIYTAGKSAEVEYATALQVRALLADRHYTIEKDGQHRAIKPSDIGILVRTKKEGIGVREFLCQMGIPCVLLNDEKILQTAEATGLLYVLEAIWAPSIGAINRALLGSIAGFDTDAILALDEEAVVNAFQGYKEVWIKDGVYPALTKFVGDFDITRKLLKTGGKERVLANLYQLIELLNQEQLRKEHGPEDLIKWLQRSINGLSTQGDEYVVRMESDDDAVKIITIHKSKGLEYGIVLAPFLDMGTDNKSPFANYRDPKSGQYVTKEKLRLTDGEKEFYRLQQEQENRRLIYVAITRSVYKCFVYKNNSNKKKNSSLGVFYDALQQAEGSELIEIATVPELHPAEYHATAGQTLQPPLFAERFELQQTNWRKLSYSGITLSGEHLPRERASNFEQEYDEFVFGKLRFGAATGNLLHDLLEKIDFTNTNKWDELTERTLKSFLPAAGTAYHALINTLMQHVVGCNIALGGKTFSLSEVPFYHRLPELEFDFPLNGFNTHLLKSLAGDGKEINTRSLDVDAVCGIMNGKIDLFFMHRNRYYILDWKSNYLGYKEDDYTKESLLQAMNEHNYHLQYLIYTLAAKKYLGSRMPDFDYEKHFGGVVYVFLRGVHAGSSNGIFTARPSLQKINALEKMLHG